MKWVLKTSSVRVATSDDDRVYRSIRDAPADLRDRIREAIEGPDARTILITNQEAYDEILKEGDESSFDMEYESAATPPSAVTEVVRADVRNEDDRRLPIGARRVLITMFAAIAALWTIWALLIQIGR